MTLGLSRFNRYRIPDDHKVSYETDAGGFCANLS